MPAETWRAVRLDTVDWKIGESFLRVERTPLDTECRNSAIIAVTAQWALNSAVECHLHTVEVIGSNPIAPTIFQQLTNY